MTTTDVALTFVTETGRKKALFSLRIRLDKKKKKKKTQSQSCSNFSPSGLTRISGKKEHGDRRAAPVVTHCPKGNEKTAMGAKSTSALAQCAQSEGSPDRLR